jgi:hypothetical protein
MPDVLEGKDYQFDSQWASTDLGDIGRPVMSSKSGLDRHENVQRSI